MRSTPRLGLAMRMIALVSAGLLAGALDREELECEEAIAHLKDCCEPLETDNICGAGCDALTLSLEESGCIEERGCDELRAAGVCERVSALSIAGAPEEGAFRAPVCP
jgi:hypothetical protein